MSLIDAFGTPVTLTRPGAGAWASGVWVDNPATTSTITASVQPAKGRELLDFPEAERTREWVKVYTSAELRTADERTGTRADVLTWRSKDYQVRQVDPWEAPGMASEPYWKALACLVEPAEEAPDGDS